MQEISSVDNSTQSPFEALKQVGPDGREYWSARDLMTAVAYDKWDNFQNAIDRASGTILNTLNEAPGKHHIADAGKMIKTGKGAERAVLDYHLSRYACYLVVMNGDPRKPEIAAAQTYFAVKTREAEVAKPKELTEEQIVAQALQITTRKVRELEAQVGELTPKAEAFEALMDADGYFTMEAAAKVLGLGRTTLFRRLRELKILMDTNLPYQKHAHHFAVTVSTWKDREGKIHPSQTTRVRPAGLDYLRKRLARELEVVA